MIQKLVLPFLVVPLIIFTIFLFFWWKNGNISIQVPISSQEKKIELVRLLEKNGLNVTSIPIEIGGSIEASVSGIKVVFSSDKNLELQVRALQLVIPKSRMEGKHISEIDLRFGKVVLRY